MGQAAQTRRKRKREELCDYCFASRIACLEYQDTHQGNRSNYKPKGLEIFKCICGPEVSCLDPVCFYSNRPMKQM